ncbi:NYN domain-containing protein [Sagittula sp. SSi028]|uniref:NYN domain-containing protein n=1 Tax=Sagittula sp. SSi028 TaxID=3400636 RepID=UPI003AF63D40
MPNDTRLLAILIDGDNASPKYAKALFEEIATLGEASVRRVYGDFASPHMNGWSKVTAEYGLVPLHSPANTTGKNASDISLVIDAMDLMHTGRFDGFVLVSSDSDFTRLASRIREQGLDVFGMGMQKTPDAFRKACKRFIYLENLDNSPEKPEQEKSGKRPLTEARDLIFRAMDSIDGDDEWYRLGDIGQVITAANPDFDTRTYGKRKLSDLVKALKVFETKTASSQLLVRRVD